MRPEARRLLETPHGTPDRPRRWTWRRVRQAVSVAALLVVAFWGLLTWRADNRVFAWDRPVSVAFVALLDPHGADPDADRRFVERFLSRADRAGENLREVEDWIRAEYHRHTGDSSDRFDFAVRGPLTLPTPPPDLPGADASFVDRLLGTRAFLEFFRELPERDELRLGSHDVYVFIYFYDFEDADRRARFSGFDSLADRRSGVGVVFAPIHPNLRGHVCCVIAHELCHTLGAGDKYEGDTSVWPHGFADPHREPLYPQERIEIMSLGRPVAPGKDEPALRLEDCVIGHESARELNWKPR